MALDYFQALRPASFRGIAFDVPEDGSSFGRRIQTHEYPGRDEPYHEDLGLSVQSFTIEALIHGSDYVAHAAALETALKSKGPGRLIHPLYGDLDVIVKSATRRQSSQSTGEVSFSISFEKYGPPLYPVASRNTGSALVDTAAASYTAVQSDFKVNYIQGLAPFLVSDARERVSAIVRRLGEALKNKGVFARLPQEIFPSRWPVDDPAGMARQAVGVFVAITDMAMPVPRAPLGGVSLPPVPRRTAIDTLRALAGFSDSFVTDFSLLAAPASRSSRARNAGALDLLFRLCALSAATRTARVCVYESREEAIAIRSAMAQALESVRDDLGTRAWDASWRAAGNLLAALSRDINERIGRLPRTEHVRIAAPRSSVALANRLYGDDPTLIFARAADLVSRNRIRHPGFMPAGSLEALIDAA